MSSVLTADDLVNIKHTVLTLERQEIARNIDPNRFFGHLRAKYVFDERDCDEIRAVSSRVGSAEVFVDTLKRKGGRGYDEFCNALMNDKTQLFLLQRLTQTLELLRAKVVERKKEKTLKNEQQRLLTQTIPPLHPLGHQFMSPASSSGPSSSNHSQSTHPHTFLHGTSSLPSTFRSSNPTNIYSQYQYQQHQQQPVSSCVGTHTAVFSTNSSGGRYSPTVMSSYAAMPPSRHHQQQQLLHGNAVTADGGHNSQHQFPHGPNPHRPLRKVQSRQTEKEARKDDPPQQPVLYQQMSSPATYTNNRPQDGGYMSNVPPNTQHMNMTDQPQYMMVPQQQPVSLQLQHLLSHPPPLNHHRAGNPMVGSSYGVNLQAYDLAGQEQQPWRSAENTAVPNMYSRGISEGGCGLVDSQMGCGSHVIGERLESEHPCGQIILARGGSD